MAIEEVDAETIDRINIYQATRVAMSAAVCRLALQPDHLLIDAMRLDLECTQTSIIYGDSLSISIAAASVLAKVYRDGRMRQLDHEYPVYGLASHKGYSTPEHKQALLAHGPSPAASQKLSAGSGKLPALGLIHKTSISTSQEELIGPADDVRYRASR